MPFQFFAANIDLSPPPQKVLRTLLKFRQILKSKYPQFIKQKRLLQTKSGDLGIIAHVSGTNSNKNDEIFFRHLLCGLQARGTWHMR